MRISKGKIKFSIIGFGGRGSVYLTALKEQFYEQFELVAVAEPDKKKQELLKNEYNLSDENIFDYDVDFLKHERLSDVVIISTQDNLHCDEVIKCLELGYDIILEKPIATSKEEVMRIYEESKKYPNQIIAICHVLRHTKFFSKVKEIIDSKELGEVIDIQHNENVGYYHFAHSYVRGSWNNSETSGPVVLTKSCHDMDILLYLLGDKHAKMISSFGSLSHFVSSNYDEKKMAPYCVDCKIENECPYSAIKLYSSKKIKSVVFDLSSADKIRENLGSSKYGRCVYKCDNNVCDHQVTIIQFEDGVTATFNLSAFTTKINRSLKVMCEFGEIRAREKPYLIEISNFRTGEVKEIDLNITQSGHGGGDQGFIKDFMESYLSNKDFSSTLSKSIESHLMAFLAEESRVNNGEVKKI